MLRERLIDWSLEDPKKVILLNQLHLERNDLLHPGFEYNYQIPDIKDEKELIRALSLETYMVEEIRQILQEQVCFEFTHRSGNNIYLRGSCATGFFPLGDIDLSHYGPKNEYTPENWPQEVIGIPVSWGNVPLEELAECMHGSLRMSASALEAVPLTPVSEEVKNIIDSVRQENKGDRKYYYLIFRLFEQIKEDRDLKIYYTGYDLRKETPGSKRTIQRICWTLRVLDPELEEMINPHSLIMLAYYKNLIPLNVVSDAFNVIRIIKGDNYSEDTFLKSAATVQNWYVSELIPKIAAEITANVEPDFVEKTKTAIDVNSKPEDLSAIIKLAGKQDKPYKEWLLLWIVSHNPSLSPENQLALWQSCLGKMVHRNTLRNLLRNPGFPLQKITRDKTVYDSHLLECYDKVTHHITT